MQEKHLLGMLGEVFLVFSAVLLAIMVLDLESENEASPGDSRAKAWSPQGVKSLDQDYLCTFLVSGVNFILSFA